METPLKSDFEITMDEPLFTFDGVVGAIRNFLAVLGMISVSACIGLYYAGFFEWLFKVAK